MQDREIQFPLPSKFTQTDLPQKQKTIDVEPKQYITIESQQMHTQLTDSAFKSIGIQCKPQIKLTALLNTQQQTPQSKDQFTSTRKKYYLPSINQNRSVTRQQQRLIQDFEMKKLSQTCEKAQHLLVCQCYTCYPCQIQKRLTDLPKKKKKVLAKKQQISPNSFVYSIQQNRQQMIDFINGKWNILNE